MLSTPYLPLRMHRLLQCIAILQVAICSAQAEGILTPSVRETTGLELHSRAGREDAVPVTSNFEKHGSRAELPSTEVLRLSSLSSQNRFLEAVATESPKPKEPSLGNGETAGVVLGVVVVALALPAMVYMLATGGGGIAGSGDDAEEQSPPLAGICPLSCLRSVGLARPAPRQGRSGLTRATSSITVQNPTHVAVTVQPEPQHGPLSGKAWLEQRKAEKAKQAAASGGPAGGDSDASAKRGRGRSRSGSTGNSGAAGGKPGDGDAAVLAAELAQYTNRRASVRNLMAKTTAAGAGTSYTAPTPAPGAAAGGGGGSGGSKDKGGPRRIGASQLHGVLEEHKGKPMMKEMMEVVENTTGVDVDVLLQSVQANLHQVQQAVSSNLQQVQATMPKALAGLGQGKAPLAGAPVQEDYSPSTLGASNPVRDTGGPGRPPPPPRSVRVAGLQATSPTKAGAPPPVRQGVSSSRLSFDPTSTVSARGAVPKPTAPRPAGSAGAAEVVLPIRAPVMPPKTINIPPSPKEGSGAMGVPAGSSSSSGSTLQQHAARPDSAPPSNRSSVDSYTSPAAAAAAEAAAGSASAGVPLPSRPPPSPTMGGLPPAPGLPQPRSLPPPSMVPPSPDRGGQGGVGRPPLAPQPPSAPPTPLGNRADRMTSAMRSSTPTKDGVALPPMVMPPPSPSGQGQGKPPPSPSGSSRSLPMAPLPMAALPPITPTLTALPPPPGPPATP